MNDPIPYNLIPKFQVTPDRVYDSETLLLYHTYKKISVIKNFQSTRRNKIAKNQKPGHFLNMFLDIFYYHLNESSFFK
jgi:hypothetical protein